MVSDARSSEQGLPAGFVSRLVAFTIDLAIVVAVGTVVTVVAQFVAQTLGMSEDLLLILGIATSAATFVFQGVYAVVLTAIGGQTIGKRIMGLRVVRLDGSRVKLGRSFKRYVGYFLSLPLFWGYLLVLVDNRRQAFQDKFADTIVIYFMSAEGEAGPLEHYLAAIAARRRARLAAERAALEERLRKHAEQPVQPASPNS